MTKVLIIDKERSIRNTLKERLEYEGYTVDASQDADAAQQDEACSLAQIVVSDSYGFETLVAKEIYCGLNVPIIVLSDTALLCDAVHAIRDGAFDFIPKPINMNALLQSLRDAEAISSGEAPHSATQSNSAPHSRTTRQRASHVEQIIGDSRQIQHVKHLIEKVAPSEARVLITGANGTGKELVARWLHEKSPRFAAPFIEVNCAAIPSELIESELFGHEKGAFTSAIKQRKGKFEQAHGGTLFLDEVGDMSLSAQAKVLRALQEKKISRVGSDKDVDVNVRVVAATNKNLQQEIQNGNFREDLYHRLSVIVISVPPLANHSEDIPLLVNYFVDKISAEYGVKPKDIDTLAIEELGTMGWSGNIRELRNVIERLIILSGERITVDDVKMYALGVE